MALIRIDPLFDQSVRKGERGRRDYVRVFSGRSNNPYDSPEDIAESRLCPQVGDSDLKDKSARIIDVDVKRAVDDAPCEIWHITVTSSTEYDDKQDVHPLALPAETGWYAEQFERYTEIDAKGKRITTSAGTVLPMKVEDSRWVISVSKNLAQIPIAIASLNNKINSQPVTIDRVTLAKKTVMCKSIRIGNVQKETFDRKLIEFRVVSFQLHYRPEGWKARTPDVDFVELIRGRFRVKNKDGTYKRTKDGKDFIYRQGVERRRIMIGDPKEYVTDPWPLAADGSKLPEDYQPEDVRMIESDVYPAVDFSILPLK